MNRPPPPPAPGAEPRRDFLLKAATVALGGAAVAPPMAAGIAFALDPVRRQTPSAAGFSRITTLDALPADGVPRKFAVLADRVDAWNRFPRTAVGAVYLRRAADQTVTAVHSICPHAGCFVDYQPGKSQFYCPCHNSAFSVDGAVSGVGNPSARGLDSLPVEIRNG
ncbi:MAG: Rieske (2Fe-2S) protein, partial [Verrucomicrobiales bacterium]|nr:Rieske (2Fe-2S) protein [Verrucomicrobiales bacterium]